MKKFISNIYYDTVYSDALLCGNINNITYFYLSTDDVPNEASVSCHLNYIELLNFKCKGHFYSLSRCYRFCKYRKFMVEDIFDLRTFNAGKPFEKFVYRSPVPNVLKECGNRNAGSAKHPRATYFVCIALHCRQGFPLFHYSCPTPSTGGFVLVPRELHAPIIANIRKFDNL